MINLGDKVKDKVSGFEGIAVARHSYLNGCDRISIQPVIKEDGTLPEDETFDEPQLEVIEVEYARRANNDIGGPEKYPPKRRY
jgi:hypothetical protein